jgi:hypothetical protein
MLLSLIGTKHELKGMNYTIKLHIGKSDRNKT